MARRLIVLVHVTSAPMDPFRSPRNNLVDQTGIGPFHSNQLHAVGVLEIPNEAHVVSPLVCNPSILQY